MVKNLPANQETQVRSLGWEDPWRMGWLPTPGFMSGKSHGQRSLVATVAKWLRCDLAAEHTCIYKADNERTSVVAQWGRIRLPVQRTWVQFLTGDLTAHKPVGSTITDTACCNEDAAAKA